MSPLPRIALLVVLVAAAGSTCSSQSGTAAPLSLERIFLKPYLAGSRPSLSSITADSRRILYRWDSSAANRQRYWMMNADGSGARMLADTLLGEIAWSPDLKTVACTRNGDLFLTDTSFHTVRRVTKTEAREYGLQFSHDGNLIAFAGDNKIMALALGRPGVLELARATGKDVSVNLIDFTPDDRRVVFTESNREGLPEFVVPRYTGKEVATSSFKGGVGKTRIGIAPVDTGSIVWAKLPGDERYYSGDVSLSPDGRFVLIERFSADRKKRELYVADTDSGMAKLVFEERDEAWVEGGLATTRWTKDGGQILTTSERDGWNHLWMMKPDGSGKTKLTTGEWEIHWFDIVPDGIVFQANREEHHQWQLYRLEIGTRKVTRLSSREGSYDSPVLSKDGSFIVASYSTFNTPDELVRVSTHAATSSPATGVATNGAAPFLSERLLTNTVPEEFRRVNWITPEIVHFKARDGATVPAMIYKPAVIDSSKRYPVVVFVHGAGYLQNVFRGWSYYHRETMFHTRLVQRGYVVLEVEYRGSAGYGRKFRTDVAMYLGGKDLDDEVDGLEYLEHLGYIDRERVGIYGGSYGGFMALMGLFRTDRYACGAALRAVTSWENYYRHNPWYTGARLGTPEEHPEAYRISSPLTYADSLKRPLLILHGMVDDNVFFQDAVQLVAKLQKGKKAFELMVYPDEAHSFSEPDSWLDEYGRIERFFDQHLLKAR